MTDFLTLVGDLSTFVQVGWLVWLLWAAALVVWYQRARIKVPAWPPAPHHSVRSTSAKATADKSAFVKAAADKSSAVLKSSAVAVKSAFAKATADKSAFAKAAADKSGPDTVPADTSAFAEASADNSASADVAGDASPAAAEKTAAAPPKIVTSRHGFSPEFLAALGLDEPEPDEDASDKSVYS